MARFFRKRDEARGQVPGSLIFIGKQKVERTTINVIDYDADNLNEFELTGVDQLADLATSSSVTWINIYGLHDIETIRSIGARFTIHALWLEDVLNTGQRPKLEVNDDSIFFVLKMFRYDAAEGIVHAEQLSMIIGPNYLVTFQEQPMDVFGAVRDRIRKKKGRIRTVGTDYLAYALLDSVVENYIDVIERIGERVEELDEEILDDPGNEIIAKISNTKREVNYLRKSVRPARDAVILLGKLEHDILGDQIPPFLKDLQDLITHAAEAIETYREMLTDQLNIYHSTLSNKMNDVMKVLTIFAAIFIPLTFIAGIYGTNFEYFPELHYRYSYFVFWGVIVAVGAGMLVFFKKKGWF
jgi:magnesium transporter